MDRRRRTVLYMAALSSRMPIRYTTQSPGEFSVMRQPLRVCASLLLFLLAAVGISLPAMASSQDFTIRSFVEDLLVEKGLERSRATAMLADPRVAINTEIVIKNLFYSSPKPSEKQPLYMEIDPAYIEKGREFITSHSGTFTSIGYQWDVSPEIITAILIVESRLGTYPMRYNVFLAYTNLAVLLDPDYFARVQDRHIETYPLLSDERTIQRAQTRGRWAVNQLYGLIVLSDELEIDPLEIHGSFAGAMGPGQFIPTSFLTYGVDGDGDGRRDPFNIKDAMASIANYLTKAGWGEGASVEKKRKAVWHYNRSEIYVNTIMMLYRKLSEDKIYSPH